MFWKAGDSCFASHWKPHGYPFFEKSRVEPRLLTNLKYVQMENSVNSNTEHGNLLYVLDTHKKKSKLLLYSHSVC